MARSFLDAQEPLGRAVGPPPGAGWIACTGGSGPGGAAAPEEKAQCLGSWPPAPSNVAVPNVALAFPSQINSVLFIWQEDRKRGGGTSVLISQASDWLAVLTCWSIKSPSWINVNMEIFSCWALETCALFWVKEKDPDFHAVWVCMLIGKD